MSFLSARTKMGFPQARVAKEMQVSEAAVSMWENGKTRPRASLLVKLAGLYCCTVEDLLTGNPGEDQPKEAVPSTAGSE